MRQPWVSERAWDCVSTDCTVRLGFCDLNALVGSLDGCFGVGLTAFARCFLLSDLCFPLDTTLRIVFCVPCWGGCWASGLGFIDSFVIYDG